MSLILDSGSVLDEHRWPVRLILKMLLKEQKVNGTIFESSDTDEIWSSLFLFLQISSMFNTFMLQIGASSVQHGSG